jgi:hypothetical protein
MPSLLTLSTCWHAWPSRRRPGRNRKVLHMTMRRATRGGPDLIVHGQGSNYLLLSNSVFGRDWISDHAPENAVTFGQGIVVERRYIGAIIEAAGNDGNVVAVLIMPRDLAHGPNVCRILTERGEHQRRERGEARRLKHRQPFLDRISYPAALLVAVVVGFCGGVLGFFGGVFVETLNASEAEKVKYRSPVAIPVEMAKPPRCSIETPGYCNVLPSRRERKV